MAFKYEFKQIDTNVDKDKINEAVDTAMRVLNKEMKAIGAVIELKSNDRNNKA